LLALLKPIKRTVPQMVWRRAASGSPIPTGVRLGKIGETPEQAYARYAPATAKSLPERILYGWLTIHKVLFDYQTSVLGGRAVPGGAVLDFVVYDKPTPIAIRVMSYWHKTTEWGDEIQRQAVEELGYTVVDVDEWEINDLTKLEGKMREILFGAPKTQGTI
jgi:hypothetical protein